MKRLMTCLIGLALLAGIAVGEPRAVPFYVATASTNAAAAAGDAVTNRISACYFHGLYLDLGGYASPTVDVDVVAVGGLGSIERTLYSADSVAADGEYFPVDIVDTTAGVEISNTPKRIPIVAGDKVAVRVYDANVTNDITARVWVYVDEQP